MDLFLLYQVCKTHNGPSDELSYIIYSFTGTWHNNKDDEWKYEKPSDNE